jgi:mannose-6-phosphate isomerase-like protein (cupin superfamily)
MRLLVIASLFALATPAVAAAQQQQPAAPAAQDAMRLFASSAEVARMIANASTDRKPDQAILVQRIVSLAPFNVNLEYRAAVGGAAIHEQDAELFYVLGGSGTMVTGGRLVNETRPNPNNRNGSAIEGGESRHVTEGDFIMVPPGTGHWFSAIEGRLVLMSLHLPVPQTR